MHSRKLGTFLIAGVAVVAITWLVWPESAGPDRAEIASSDATSAAADETPAPPEITPPAPDPIPRDDQAPLAPEPASQAASPAQEEPEETVWKREAEGKSPAELRVLAEARFQAKLMEADFDFDELYRTGRYEVIDEEPPLVFSSRPGDENLLVEVRSDGTRMVRLVLPETGHEELYRELRRFNWMKDEASRRASETKGGG
jgi:hypothetical protein